ncbi:MAG: nucleoside deaminase [Porphyromonadaceae bacterium]|nr:nucleoside deaminase [Porphyromonadaceae bacterium]
MQWLPYDDEYYMRIALQEAQMAYEEGEVPIGAVVVAHGRVLARAHNRVEALGDPTAHAEMLAITAASSAVGSKYLVDCQLYVTIEPCPMCAGAIRWGRLARVVYGAGEEKFGYRVFSPQILPRACRITAGVLAEEARELMQRFFRSKR